MNPTQLHRAADFMAAGSMGAFARHIGRAYLVADLGNSRSLAEAFHPLFTRAYELAQIGA